MAACAAAGVRGLEFDVQLSADATPFVFHDDELGRMTGAEGRFGETCDRALARLRVAGGAPIPELVQVLQACEQYALAANVELKVGSGGAERLAAAVLRCLNDFRGRVPIVVSSFSPEVLSELRQLGCEFPLGLLCEQREADFLPLLTQCGAQALHLAEGNIDPQLVEALTEAGIPLAAWTVNEPERAEALRRMGVATVISDLPMSALLLPLNGPRGAA